METLGDCLIQRTDLAQDQLRLLCMQASKLQKLKEQEMAKELKLFCDQTFKGKWHCIVGKSFAVFIDHADKGFCHFILDSYAVIVFRTI